MHQAVARAFEEIDAAIFSGDTFSTDSMDLATLKGFLARWGDVIPQLEEELAEYETEIEEMSYDEDN